MKPLAGRTFGIVGALDAFPRRLAARAVERLGGTLRRGVGRATTDVVVGRRWLATGAAGAIEARIAAERTAGRRLHGEGSFRRLIGAARAAPEGAVDRDVLVARSGLDGTTVDLLAVADAFETGSEPFSFRDLILAKKYAALLAGGADWLAIARSVHRVGAAGPLTAETLHAAEGRVWLSAHDGLAEIDGQLRLDLGPEANRGPDLDALFDAAETAEAAGEFEAAARLYGRCLDADPDDAVAAFNRGNCLRALGRLGPAAQDYVRAARRDPSFVEAWFNLASLMAGSGHAAAARRHYAQAIAIDPAYGDAVYNLATLEFEMGNLGEAQRWWERYLELDRDSEWARTAERGLQYVRLRSRQ
jgi:tetratricopeptide (TPR) repeat protein